MIEPKIPCQLFLLGQQLSELVGVDDAQQRRFHVCGSVSEMPAQDEQQRREPERDPWQRIERQAVREQAASRAPRMRVALVCDAGLGKTTNLEWLAAAITREPGRRQIPFVLRLDTPDDLDRLVREHTHPDTLLEWMAAEVKRAAGGEIRRHRQALSRMQSFGRITLFIDGLDHALSRPGVPRMLSEILQAEQWRDCPVWVAGRPYAFENAWGVFANPEWEFLSVEPLAEPEIRFYLTRHVGGDWYDEIAAEGRGLLEVPRLLRLTARILDPAVRTAGPSEEVRRAAVQKLDLRTAADIYNLAYFTPGEWVDPGHLVPGQQDHAQPRGLLASGLVGTAERIGLLPTEKPSRTNYQRCIERTAALLGAIAFEMFAANSNAARPEPTRSAYPRGSNWSSSSSRLPDACSRPGNVLTWISATILTC